MGPAPRGTEGGRSADAIEAEAGGMAECALAFVFQGRRRREGRRPGRQQSILVCDQRTGAEEARRVSFVIIFLFLFGSFFSLLSFSFLPFLSSPFFLSIMLAYTYAVLSLQLAAPFPLIRFCRHRHHPDQAVSSEYLRNKGRGAKGLLRIRLLPAAGNGVSFARTSSIFGTWNRT